MIKLYVIPGSHPCICVQRALELKGLEYQRVDLLPVIHKLTQRLIFDQSTVPALRDEGIRIVGSKRIMRYLDLLKSTPLLYPEEPTLGAKVEEAEQWGDEVLQPMGRRLLWKAFAGNREALRSYAADAKLPIPLDVAMFFSPLIVKAAIAINGVSDQAVREDLRSLKGYLDRIDSMIAQGTIGGEHPNAADLQIASNLRVLMSIEDLASSFEGRQAAELALKLFPEYQGKVPQGAIPSQLMTEVQCSQPLTETEKAV